MSLSTAALPSHTIPNLHSLIPLALDPEINNHQPIQARHL